MFTLHQYFLCPSSRFIRMCLEEKKISFQLQIENYWDPQNNFLLMNPAGYFPVLVNEDNYPIVGSSVIMEYIEDLNNQPYLLNFRHKSEVRRLVYWFEIIFKKDVITPLLFEKVYKPVQNNLNPNINVIRTSIENMKFHMNYFNIIINENDYLVGDNISYADLYFVSSLSIIDYIGELNFIGFEKVKDLYFKLKSRPSFKNILKDRIIGINPSKSYEKFDY